MKKDTQKKLEQKYQFQTEYIKDVSNFKKEIMQKTIKPYQVEFQAPPRGKKICWLECPYCYGLAAEDNGERLEKKRGLEILEQILDGGVKKIIFAGYATDPLNCSYIEDLLELTIKKKAVFGFNTKAIRVSERFLDVLKDNNIVDTSYISLSVDAGSNDTYNKIHAVKSKANIYDKVLINAQNLGSVKKLKNFDLSAAYLVNSFSGAAKDFENFIKDFKDAGCNLLRFTFPQKPKDVKTGIGVIPSQNEIIEYKKIIKELKIKYQKPDFSILIVDADDEHSISSPRTIPCYARYIFPTVGFDGWLYNCSQSSAPNFRQSALGDLVKNDFWKLYYNYQVENFNEFRSSCDKKIVLSGCKCDRKEHILNKKIIDSKLFKNV